MCLVAPKPDALLRQPHEAGLAPVIAMGMGEYCRAKIFRIPADEIQPGVQTPNSEANIQERAVVLISEDHAVGFAAACQCLKTDHGWGIHSADVAPTGCLFLIRRAGMLHQPSCRGLCNFRIRQHPAWMDMPNDPAANHSGG